MLSLRQALIISHGAGRQVFSQACRQPSLHMFCTHTVAMKLATTQEQMEDFKSRLTGLWLAGKEGMENYTETHKRVIYSDYCNHQFLPIP